MCTPKTGCGLFFPEIMYCDEMLCEKGKTPLDVHVALDEHEEEVAAFLRSVMYTQNEPV